MVERNDALFKKSIQNIKTNPLKYLKNILNNISRLLFNIPGSYMFQSPVTILRIIPNSILLNFIFISLIITAKNFKKYLKR